MVNKEKMTFKRIAIVVGLATLTIGGVALAVYAKSKEDAAMTSFNEQMRGDELMEDAFSQEYGFEHTPKEVCDMVDAAVTTILEKEGYKVTGGNSFMDDDFTGGHIMTMISAERSPENAYFNKPMKEIESIFPENIKGITVTHF